MTVKNLFIISFASALASLFVSNAIVERYVDVKNIRQMGILVPHIVGSDCTVGSSKVAILNKYLDDGENLVYDVMILDDDPEPLTLTGINHVLIENCEE